jgi:hypothetical protein
MSAATVIESLPDLEPVGPDPFVDDLEERTPESEARLAELVQRVGAGQPRRIYD